MVNTQKTLLQIDGDAAGGAKALNDTEKGIAQLVNSLGRLSKAFDSTDKSADTFVDANGRLRNSAGRFVKSTEDAQNATGGAMDSLGGLVGAFMNLNPATVLAGLGIVGFGAALAKGVQQLKAFASEIVAVVGPAQNLQINLEALAARELVNAGQFENAGDAMEVAGVAAESLLKQLQGLGLESPFENSVVNQTFKQGMAYGFVSDQALELTRATLNMSAGLGKSSAEMSMIGLVMGQIRSSGKLLTQDIRQLKSRGVDLAAILRDELGVSIDGFNSELQAGTKSMDDLLDAFVRYSDTNFGGASKRLAGTVQGLRSSFQDLKEIALTTTFKPALDVLTEAAARAFDFVSNIVTSSGMFEAAGVVFEWIARSLVSIGDFLAGGIKRAIDLFSGIQFSTEGAAFWLNEISKSLRAIWAEIFQMIYPALQQVNRVMRAIKGIDFSIIGVQFQDTVNVVLSTLNNLLLTIRNLLAGQGLSAFDPLRSSFVDVLTLMALAWDRFGADAVRWGWGFVTNLATGIWEAAKSTLSTVMTAVGNLIGLFIKPGSPPKKGPLSHIVEWARGVMNVFLEGFKTADFDILRDSLAPIKSALQDAVSAGTIDEAEFLQTFGDVREMVAGLIADFRATGEISEEALGSISERLGEGGDELVKYLRLQLKFRKAQEDLTAIQEEVAEAQARGFVPQELAQKLQAAEDVAEAAQDELAWQKEYLAAQQESVDLQLQMVNAVKKLTDALEKAAKASKKVAAGAGGGAEVSPVGIVESPLTDLLGGIGGGGEALEAISGISEEFEIMRGRVEAFINLPISTHLENMGRALADALGLDYDKITEFFDGLDDLDTKKIADTISEFFLSVFDSINEDAPRYSERIGDIIERVFNGLIRIVEENGPRWGEDIGRVLGIIAGVLLDKLTVDMPRFLRKLGNILGGLIVDLALWMISEGPRFALQLYVSFLNIIVKWVEKLNEFKAAFIGLLVGVLKGYFDGLMQTGPEWMTSLVDTGAEIIASIEDGIAGASSGLSDTFDKAFTKVSDVLTGFWDENSPIFSDTEGALTSIGSYLVETFTPNFETSGSLLSSVFSPAVLSSNSALGRLRDTIAGKLSTALDGMKTKLDEDIIPAFTRVRDFIRDKLIAKFTDLETSIRETLGNAFTWLKDNVLGPVAEKFREISDGVTAIVETFPGASEKFDDMEQKLGPFNIALDAVRTTFDLLGAAIKFTTDWLEKAIDAIRRWRDEKGRDTDPNPDQGAQSLIPTSSLRRGLINPLGLNLAGIQGALSGAGAGGGQINMYFGERSLSFPNVRDGRDAGGVVRELNRLALQGSLTSKTKGV